MSRRAAHTLIRAANTLRARTRDLRHPSLILLISSVLFCAAPPTKAPGAEKQKDPREQYQKLQKEMESQKRKLEDTRRREHSVLEDLDTLAGDISSVEADLRKYRRRLRKTEAEIRMVDADIASNRAYLSNKKNWVKRKLKAMHRHGEFYETVLVAATADDVAQALRRWRYLERITMHERKAIDDYVETLRKLEEKERQLQDLHAELKRSEERIRFTELTLLERRKDKEMLLSSVQKDKSSQENLLRELQESSRRLLDVIRKLEEKETYEGKGFPALKGKLGWPVEGKIAVPYGSQKDPRFNTPVFRNGVYIQTDSESIRTVYGGKVVFAEWFKGYGNLLIVNHGEGYHTLYANLSEIFFKVGDIIKIHDVVGKAGESGILNAPSLYFEIRYKGKPLNPTQWLRKR